MSYESQVVKDDEQIILGAVQSKHYSVSFDFIKSGGKWDKGFKFIFGRTDDHNQYSWSLGGWQNQDCLISSHKNGADSVLTQSIWKVEMDKKYSCVLEVKNRQLITKINGVVFNKTEDLPLVIKPAYINAVYDEENDLYRLKIVNVREVPFVFELENEWQSATYIQLSAAIDAQNTLENPQQVFTQIKKLASDTTELTVDPYSIMFLEINK